MQAEREGEADVVGRELERLWTALDMPGIDVDRAALTSLLEGSMRLHAGSIQKVRFSSHMRQEALQSSPGMSRSIVTN